jgi:hypothetical protein
MTESSKTFPTNYKNDNKKAIIKWNDEWEEYQVWYYIDNKFQKEATYHTDDLEDAVSTAKQMVK